MVAKTILIADGGSTKTDWSIVSGNREIDRIRTGGINPFFQTEEEISAEIRDNLIPRIRESDSVGAVYFYGAGCAFTEKNEIIRRSVTRYLPVPVEVGSDLLAAARALCGDSPGIACILGTGSNSCLYDGKGIVKSISPLGFVLGDEGSGAVLGKLLVGPLAQIAGAGTGLSFFLACRLILADICLKKLVWLDHLKVSSLCKYPVQ